MNSEDDMIIDISRRNVCNCGANSPIAGRLLLKSAALEDVPIRSSRDEYVAFIMMQRVSERRCFRRIRL